MVDFDHAVPMYIDHLTKLRAELDAGYTYRSGNPNQFNFRYVLANGRNYIKVIACDDTGHRSCHSFIVKKADLHFKQGDILKAATWNAPARNFRRGNIMEQNYSSISWAGC